MEESQEQDKKELGRLQKVARGELNINANDNIDSERYEEVNKASWSKYETDFEKASQLTTAAFNIAKDYEQRGKTIPGTKALLSLAESVLWGGGHGVGGNFGGTTIIGSPGKLEGSKPTPFQFDPDVKPDPRIFVSNVAENNTLYQFDPSTKPLPIYNLSNAEGFVENQGNAITFGATNNALMTNMNTMPMGGYGYPGGAMLGSPGGAFLTEEMLIYGRNFITGASAAASDWTPPALLYGGYYQLESKAAERRDNLVEKAKFNEELGIKEYMPQKRSVASLAYVSSEFSVLDIENPWDRQALYSLADAKDLSDKWGNDTNTYKANASNFAKEQQAKSNDESKSNSNNVFTLAEINSNINSVSSVSSGNDEQDTGICKVQTIYSEDEHNTKNVSANQKLQMQNVSMYGINPGNIRDKNGILSFDTELPGGNAAARECFKNLAGFYPQSIAENFTKSDGTIVHYRVLGKSGHSKVEINGKNTNKMHEKITFK